MFRLPVTSTFHCCTVCGACLFSTTPCVHIHAHTVCFFLPADFQLPHVGRTLAAPVMLRLFNTLWLGKGVTGRVGLWEGDAAQALFADTPNVPASPPPRPFRARVLSRSAPADVLAVLEVAPHSVLFFAGLVHQLEITKNRKVDEGEAMNFAISGVAPSPYGPPRSGTWRTMPERAGTPGARVPGPGPSAARAIVRCAPCAILRVCLHLWRIRRNSHEIRTKFLQMWYEIRAHECYFPFVSGCHSTRGPLTNVVRNSCPPMLLSLCLWVPFHTWTPEVRHHGRKFITPHHRVHVMREGSERAKGSGARRSRSEARSDRSERCERSDRSAGNRSEASAGGAVGAGPVWRTCLNSEVSVGFVLNSYQFRTIFCEFVRNVYRWRLVAPMAVAVALPLPRVLPPTGTGREVVIPMPLREDLGTAHLWPGSQWPAGNQSLPGSRSSRPAPTGSRSIFTACGSWPWRPRGIENGQCFHQKHGK